MKVGRRNKNLVIMKVGRREEKPRNNEGREKKNLVIMKVGRREEKPRNNEGREKRRKTS